PRQTRSSSCCLPRSPCAPELPRLCNSLAAVPSLQFGPPAANVSKVRINVPTVDTGWAGEISLNVEWAHAVAPAAKILLVEARSASCNDLLTAVDYDGDQPGVVALPMSGLSDRRRAGAAVRRPPPRPATPRP